MLILQIALGIIVAYLVLTVIGAIIIEMSQ